MRSSIDPGDPWFSEFQKNTDVFSRPAYHTTRRASSLTRTIKKGDIIWIVGQIRSPWGNLPPGIDARIKVDHLVVGNDGSTRFVASHDSSWLPLADATAILGKLETIDASGGVSRLNKTIGAPIGLSLQSMRRLHTPEVIENWCRHIRAAPHHFVSYRICDGTFGAFSHVRSLLEKGKVVFWDRWCLPRRLAERRELVDDKRLDRYLMKQLQRSQLVWGIETSKYAALGSYSQRERDKAIRLGVYRAAPIRH
jgi:hypothetical protein